MLVSEGRAESEAAREMAALREQGDYRRAEEYAAEQQRRDDLSDTERAELAIQLALVYSQQALTAPPRLQDALWTKAEMSCAAFLDDWPRNPRRLLVDVQWGLVSLARGRQARRSGDGAQAVQHLRSATRRFHEINEAVERELIEYRLRPAARSPDALDVAELESLETNVAFQLARAHRQLALCYPPRTADHDDALLQAVQRLTPLAQRTPADELSWNARVELAACLRDLGRTESSQKMVADWLRENPPADVEQRLSTGAAAMPRAVPLQRDDEFGAALRAAAVEREAGRFASAAERYRQLALRNPNHSQASEAHLRAILCIADLLRESSAEDRPALAESYETLLREHLTHWPTQAGAERVRLWLGQLLASQREWPEALAVLQQVERDSAIFSESLPLRIEALARGGQAADARALIEQSDNLPVDATLRTVAGIDSLLRHRSPNAIDRRELGELALSLLAVVDARRSDVEASAMSRLNVWRAAALAAAGNRAAALAQYAALAAQSPDDGDIQERYAALLAASDSAAEWRHALKRWQEVESRSRRGGPRWRRARRARIELLTRLGERTEADRLVRLTRLLYPDWNDGAPPQ